jgi:pyruvate dehydrogenase E2 component (dihydrolipoyllysine-residue acetyltransferase)
MAVSIVMPALEMAQDSGKLIAWKKHEGDRVRKGEPLLEIETDKAVVEIEAPSDGILVGVTARPGAVVPVGTVVAWLTEPGETVAAPAAAVMISPKARRLAQERGIPLAGIKGSGPGGEIVAADIPEADSPDHRPEIPDLHRRYASLMAERTAQSWTSVPHFFLTRDVDASVFAEVHRTLRTAAASVTDLMVALVARVLKNYPAINASWSNGGIQLNSDVHVAIAIAAAEAVVTGVVRHADEMSPGDIGVRRKELANRAVAGRLRPDDISGATFTISNLGMYGVEAFTAIIVPPQAGILAVGAIAERIVALEGQPVVRPMMTLTLGCDHRAVDGVQAARFLNAVAEAIARPGVFLNA